MSYLTRGRHCDNCTLDRNGNAGSISRCASQRRGALETGQVKTWLTADSRVDASDINVDTNEGTKTVRLRGTVPADSQKTHAGQIARDKAVGYTVVNELTIRPK